MPWREVGTIAVTLSGAVTFGRGAPDGPRFVTVDSTGQLLAAWGRPGEGPGENWSGRVASADSVIVVVATAPPAVQVFSTDGHLISELRDQPVDGFPQATVGDSIDQIFGGRLVGGDHILEDSRGPIIRACIYRRCERTLLPANDSILNVVHLATPRRDGLRWPPYAAEPGRFVLGDGVGYRLWMFDDDGKVQFEFGRSVAPRALTEVELDTDRERWVERLREGVPIDTQDLKARLLSEPLPHFGYASMGFDGAHRLWVSGWTHDSTFLDVFADSTFLGRITIACVRDRGALGIRGHWIAMMCTDEQDLERPVRLRVFRIREQARDALGGT